jgi:AraC-like DNA-binding protein
MKQHEAPNLARQADDPCTNYRGSIWRTPGLRIRTSRSWGSLSVLDADRVAGEAIWRSDRHRVGLLMTDIADMTDVRRPTYQIENGPALQPVAPMRRITFYPAGITTRLHIGRHRFVHLLCDPASWRAVLPEEAARAELDSFEPINFDDPMIAESLAALADEIDGGFVDQLRVDSLSLLVAVQILRRFAGPAPAPNPNGLSGKRLTRVVDYIETHLGERLSLSEIAAVACLSPYHFSRSFKRAMGVSVHRYVVRRRINRAKKLVLRTNLPLAEIGYAVGFDSQASFTASFTQNVGLSPGRIRATG